MLGSRKKNTLKILRVIGKVQFSIFKAFFQDEKNFLRMLKKGNGKYFCCSKKNWFISISVNHFFFLDKFPANLQKKHWKMSIKLNFIQELIFHRPTRMWPEIEPLGYKLIYFPLFRAMFCARKLSMTNTEPSRNWYMRGESYKMIKNSVDSPQIAIMFEWREKHFRHLLERVWMWCVRWFLLWSLCHHLESLI